MANNTLLASAGNPFTTLGGAEWTAINTLSKCTVVSGNSRANTLSVEAGQVYTGVTFPNDQISECAINLNNEASSNFELCVRIQSGAYSGYKVAIGGPVAGSATIYRMDAGVATQLATITNGPITAFVSGDLWQFVAAGSVLAVYQNFTRVLYTADATYTGGSPGFAQFSSTDLTHSNGLAWNGYSIIQQDGIWQKRGVVIPLATADIASSGFGVWNPSWVDQGPASLLSGTVFRMVFNGQGQSAGNPGATFYGESADGVTWTRRNPAVITNFTIESIGKIGSTFYGLGQTGQAQGTGPVNVYTSTDLITWTLAASSVLTVGGAGAWDAGALYVQCNPVLLNGTWYLLYAGNVNPNSPVNFNSGIATSPDLLTWTKYLGTGGPVLSPAVSGPINRVGNTFYTWTAAGPGLTHKRLSSTNAFNPVETIRYASTDMINWTPANGVRSLHNTQLYESPNSLTGNATSSIIIDIGGRAYNYYIGSPSDSTAPQYYQISLAVGPASIAQIITQNEDGVVQKSTDSFPGANGDLSSSWSTPVGGTKLTIVSNKVRATSTSAYNIMLYSGGTFTANQYAEVTCGTVASNAFNIVGVRIQSGSNSGYFFQVGGPLNTLNSASANIVKVTNGTGVAIGPAIINTPQIGDVFRLTVVDNVLTAFQNGAVVLQVQDTANSFPTGTPGMAIFTGTLANSEISAWAGGNSSVTPSYSGGSGTADDMLNLTRWCTRIWG